MNIGRARLCGDSLPVGDVLQFQPQVLQIIFRRRVSKPFLDNQLEVGQGPNRGADAGLRVEPAAATMPGGKPTRSGVKVYRVPVGERFCDPGRWPAHLTCAAPIINPGSSFGDRNPICWNPPIRRAVSTVTNSLRQASSCNANKAADRKDRLLSNEAAVEGLHRAQQCALSACGPSGLTLEKAYYSVPGTCFAGKYASFSS